MASASAGNTQLSPVYSMSSAGCSIELAHLASEAFEESPDQVDSHDSGVTIRPKPTLPRFEMNGSLPQSEPT
ncbi:hypothetical protein D9M69_411720 [compost metagenome]